MRRIYCVLLRKPYDGGDLRTDPIYEIGSFGSTGCHSKNLLSEKGCKEKRIQEGDMLVFIQNRRVVFITPPIIHTRKYDNYNVVVWNPNWEVKEKRPLKLKFAMKLDLSHARMINPRIKDSKKISSHLRTYSKPIVNPHQLIRDFKAFVNQQKAKHGNAIFVERFCQTFCEDGKCEECDWLIKTQNKRAKYISHLKSRLLPHLDHSK